jgi:hypothetical protein
VFSGLGFLHTEKKRFHFIILFLVLASKAVLFIIRSFGRIFIRACTTLILLHGTSSTRYN